MANYKSIYTGAEIDSAIGKANTALQEHQELKTINNESLVGEGNITIEGTSYTAGENIQISEENVISATDTIYDDTELREAIAGKQEKSEPFGSDLVVDDTRLEFRGQSVNPCKSVPFFTDLHVFENF
jgi:hypothetical protein